MTGPGVVESCRVNGDRPQEVRAARPGHPAGDGPQGLGGSALRRGRRPDPRVLPPHRCRRPDRAHRRRPVRRPGVAVPARRQPPAGPGERARVHPQPRRQRLVGRRPLRHRDRHRRHVVPRRLGDHGAGQAAARDPPGRAPAVRRRPRHHRRARERAPDQGRVEAPGRGRHPRELDAHRDQPARHRRGPRRARGSDPEGPARGPRLRRGLGQDAGPGPRDRRGAHDGAAAARRRADRARPGLPDLAGRRPLRLPRLPRVPPRARGRRRDPPGRPGHGARHPPRRPGPVPGVREAAGGRQGQGPREDPARAVEGQLPRDRAPAGVPRLRRREDVRRERRGQGRAPVPRPAVQRGLHGVDHPHPAAAREGRRRAGADRRRAAQPRGQEPDGHPRDVPARRDLPHAGRGAGRGHPGRAADRRPPPAARLRPPRDLRPLRLRALLPAPRPLQHGRPRAVLADPARPLPRRERRVQRQDERVDDRPRALRRAPPARGRDPRRRRRRPRADVHRRVPLLARRLRQRDRDRVRRGPRRAARPQVRRLVPRGLQGGLHRDHGRAGRGPAGGHRDRPRHRHLAVLAARRRSRGGAPQGVPRRLAAVAVAGAADADLDGRRGPRRAAVRARRARPADVRLRVRPPVRTRAARPDARPVPGRHPGGLGRLQRDRRVQLPRPRRRADLAAGDRAARVREVHEAGQLALRRRLHRGGAARQHRHRAAAVAAVRGAVRPGEERPRRPGRGPHRPGRGDRGADQARAGRRGQPRPRPDPALVPHPHQGDPAHQLLPGRRVGVRRPAPLHVVQARAVGDPRPARAAAAVRDLRVLPARRGRAPAVRRGGPWWPALVRPSRRLPHRGARPGQGADGQEHRDRPGGRQGRVLLQAAARPEQPRGVAGRGRGVLPHVHLRPPRHHRQPRRGRERAADGRGPSRRRRLVPRGGRRQGHRDVQRHRQRRGQGLRLLAG